MPDIHFRIEAKLIFLSAWARLTKGWKRGRTACRKSWKMLSFWPIVHEEHIAMWLNARWHRELNANIQVGLIAHGMRIFGTR
jgi:hypothetical protein